MTEKAIDLLERWLHRQLPGPVATWLDEQLGRLRATPSEKALHILLGMAPRRLGREDLVLSGGDLEAAQAARPGWDPTGWSVDGAARVLALASLGLEGEAFARLFVDLCGSAEVQEAVALYRGLPLYPSQALLEAQAGEGLRTNVRALFEAVAHRNPFPCEQFDENRWNQMVLKALFIGSTLAPIQGLDARANPALARILCDYAHERWAAGRAITPELWRCVGPFAAGPALADLERIAASEDPAERGAAALALAASRAPEAAPLLDRLGDLAVQARAGILTWDTLSVGD